MKKTIFVGVISIAVTAVYADPVQLASLSNVDGKILVNKGAGYVAAKPGMTLNDGDRIIALDGSHAAVVYPDGCVTELKENSLLAMSKAGCNNEPLRTGGGNEQPVRVAQAIGGGPSRNPNPGVQPGVNPGLSSPPPVIGFGQTAALIIGGVGMGAMIADSYHHSNSSRPVSPQ